MSNSDFDPDAYLSAAPASAPAAPSAPAGGFDPDSYLAKGTQTPWRLGQLESAVTDIPAEIKGAASSALSDINQAFNPATPENEAAYQTARHAPPWDISYQLDRLGAVGRGIAAVGGLLSSPVTGTGRSLIGHALAATTPAGFYGPNVTSPEDIYAHAKNEADLALAGLAPERGAVSVPGLPAVARGAKPLPAPTVAQLYDAATGDYQVARAMDVNVHPASVGNFAATLQAQMERDGLRDYLAPKTFSALKEMQTAAANAANAPAGATGMTNLADIDGMRRVFGNAASDFTNPTEQYAASRAIQGLDNYVRTVPPSDILSGDPAAAQSALESARGNYAAAKRAELIESQQEKAERQAGVSGSGANTTNTMRQRMNQILNNKSMQRGFTPQELDQIRSIAMGTPVGNLARKIGKLAPTGVVSSIPVLGALASGEPMSALALGTAGHIAKAVGEASTLQGIDALSEATRARAPLALQLRGLRHPPAPGLSAGAKAAGLLRPNPLGALPALQSPAVAYGGDNQQNVNGPPPQQKDGGAVGVKNGFAHGGKIKPKFRPESIGARKAKDGRYYIYAPHSRGNWQLVVPRR